MKDTTFEAVLPWLIVALTYTLKLLQAPLQHASLLCLLMLREIPTSSIA
jgi:hypothetical protein